jgi:hypothetical protein
MFGAFLELGVLAEYQRISNTFGWNWVLGIHLKLGFGEVWKFVDVWRLVFGICFHLCSHCFREERA